MTHTASEANRVRSQALAIFAACWLGCGASCLEAGEPVVLVETESFEELGGWVVDQQFMDLMGSPFVLAHGLGVPVQDCRTRVELPRGGRYRVWVRTRDWVAPWGAEGAPGRFEVRIAGESIGTFGDERAEWHWQDGGVHQLPASFALSLHDLTGFEGRCDALLFSADPDWTPPGGGEELASLRGEQLGWGQEPADGGDYDLVVVGGGIAGVSAAITAARLGLSVALIQDRPVLGGNGSSEVRVWPEGGTNLEPYPRVGDVVSELVRKKGPGDGNAKAAKVYDDERKLDLARAEPNLHLMLENRVNAADGDEQGIRSVVAQHTRTGRRTRVRGRWFLDSTGDGVLGHLVGADHEDAPQDNMGFSNLWNVADTNENESQLRCLCEDHEELDLAFTQADSPQPFPRCPWAIDLSDRPFPGREPYKVRWPMSDDLLGHVGGWFWESGFGKDPIRDAEWIRDLNLRAMYGAWDALKNVDRAHPNHRLKWAAFVAGKRESRRLLGDVVLDADDFRNGTDFPDQAFPCTWGIDLHVAHPDYAKRGDEDAFISWATVMGDDGKYEYAGPYWAPYRCLYSRNIPNLFMAGRNISVTHEALGAVRVMRTCGMMGEAVGVAAAVCKSNGCNPRSVYTDHLQELKALLQAGAGKDSEAVRSVPNGDTDPDLATRMQPIPTSAVFSDPDYYIWGGSMVRGDDGKCHLYYSRWPRSLGHYAWVTHSEVAHAVADSPLAEMRHADVALPERGRQHWDGMCTHNPNVHRFDGKYYLYYMGNTGDRSLGREQAASADQIDWQHRNLQRVGVAVAPSPDGPWRRSDKPLIEPTEGFFDSLCCSNPSVTRRPDGGYLMVYKAIGSEGPLPFGGPVVHVAAVSDSPTGPFRKLTQPIFTKESVAFPAEDPYVWSEGAKYYAIVKDNAGHFTGRGKSTALFESTDGADWRLSPNPLVATTRLKWNEQRHEELHSLERPQLFLDAGRPTALLFAADKDDRREHSFNVRIPLR